jgi:hypothetical protein
MNDEGGQVENDRRWTEHPDHDLEVDDLREESEWAEWYWLEPDRLLQVDQIVCTEKGQ